MRKTGLFILMLSLIASGAMAKKKPKAVPAPAVVDTTAPPPAEAQNIWYLDLSTGGRVAIQLRPDKAPKSVARIKTLTRQHFYDGLTFHRVIDGFMAQGGDPKGNGEGGSSLPDLAPEFNDLPHVRGVVSMARTDDPNTANSQFFIILQPALRLDGKYTAIGRVTSGMAYVDAIERGEPPANPSKIVHASMGADEPAPAVTQAPPEAAEKAAEAAAKAASEQAIDAQLQAEEARKAANAGKPEDAAAEAARSQTSAQGAAQAASDAAQAAGDAAKAAAQAVPAAPAAEPVAPAPAVPEAAAPAPEPAAPAPDAAAPAPEPVPQGQ